MSDILRYISLDVGGRPVVALDLNDTANFQVVSESFVVEPASKQPIMSTADRRYGGGTQVGETTDNGSVSWKALVTGGSYDGCLALVESMISHLEANPALLFLEWRPEGSSQSSLYDIRGTAGVKNSYLWKQFAGSQSWVFELSVPVAPLTRGLPMDILDLFAVDTRADYTYDSGAASNEEVIGGELRAAANVSTEQVAIHTARGYQYAANQQTAKGIPGATITGWKNGVVLKRSGSTTRIEVYVDDEGTNSRLRIDKVVGGVRTNLNTTNLPARVKNATAHWVRGRIEGNLISAEYFTSVPTPMGNPAWNLSWTLVGGDVATFGAAVKGSPGRVWIPKTVGAAVDEFSVEQYSFRNLSLPQLVTLDGAIPGDAPALADITITPSGGAAAPKFGLVAWGLKPSSGLAQAPFGILEAEAAATLTNMKVTADAEARGGSKIVTGSEPVAPSATWLIDPATMIADAFSCEIAIEVWTRVFVIKEGSCSLTLSVGPEDGEAFGESRGTDEAQSVEPTVPTGLNASAWRYVRLGVLRMRVDALRPRRWALRLGAAGTLGTAVDYLLLAPALGRAASPTAKSHLSGYPSFISSMAETSKTIKADLSALVAKPPAFGYPDHGLGGQLIEIPPGEDQVLVKLSSQIPNDPLQNGSEQLAHPASVHVQVTPRWNLVRSGS
jgi:hypothetical protein